MSAMNVANAFPTLPTRIAGAINSFQCFAFANAAAVAGPPIPALEEPKSHEKKIRIRSQTNGLHTSYTQNTATRDHS